MDSHTVNNIDLVFPLLCSSCLGPSKYIQMVRRQGHSSCRTCQLPYTSFRWKPGVTARYKHTVVCATCARSQNVCECCLLDLDLGISVAKRDSLVGQQVLPSSNKGREYAATLTEHKEKEVGLALTSGNLSSLVARPTSFLANAELKPDYLKNRPKTCSFWLKGTCNRGAECPFLHEESETKPSSSISERFTGISSKIESQEKSKSTEIIDSDDDLLGDVSYSTMNPDLIGGV
ncbi:hypothetical protein RCL1_004267 [Eukaryota sp. TZLM3-RCL]